jgi:hypothetical protein
MEEMRFEDGWEFDETIYFIKGVFEDRVLKGLKLKGIL